MLSSLPRDEQAQRTGDSLRILLLYLETNKLRYGISIYASRCTGRYVPQRIIRLLRYYSVIFRSLYELRSWGTEATKTVYKDGTIRGDPCQAAAGTANHIFQHPKRCSMSGNKLSENEIYAQNLLSKTGFAPWVWPSQYFRNRMWLMVSGYDSLVGLRISKSNSIGWGCLKDTIPSLLTRSIKGH